MQLAVCIQLLFEKLAQLVVSSQLLGKTPMPLVVQVIVLNSCGRAQLLVYDWLSADNLSVYIVRYVLLRIGMDFSRSPRLMKAIASRLDILHVIAFITFVSWV